MTATTLESKVKSLLAPGKGILAADESFSTIGKRFNALNISSTEENRGAYREMLVSTPGLTEFISGVILFDETVRQRMSHGIPITIPEALARQEIIPGIKVDKGTASLANFPGEKITQGLDGLRERLAEYRELGAGFTKWRAVTTIGEHAPTDACIKANANALALFAALSQEAGLVPIVEPEILMNGSHTIARCEEVTNIMLESVFAALFEYRVVLELMLLKTGMILSGAECPQQADVGEAAEVTLRCFRRTVPIAVPGIMFLSGGQFAEAATLRMNAICISTDVPWKLSFSGSGARSSRPRSRPGRVLRLTSRQLRRLSTIAPSATVLPCKAIPPLKWRTQNQPSLNERCPMKHEFKTGDHVEWNSEAGRVRGTIKKKVTSAIRFKTYTVRASKEDPQYLIKSDKTDHLAMHKGAALKRIRKTRKQ